MHIVSYRGPGMAGGVSAALARAWDSNLGTGGLWWHLKDNELKASSNPASPSVHVANLDDEVVKGHYRFCNDFLWPILHDLPQYAHYISEDRAYYDAFNSTLGWCLVRAKTEELPKNYFVQDYQLALIPQFLRDNAGFRALLFWHIPWPKHINEEHVEYMSEVARGMLGAEAIGFHIQEYADNFINFVQTHLTEFGTSTESQAIWTNDSVAHVEPGLWAAPNRVRANRTVTRSTKHITRVVVAPLGIDFDHWESLASKQMNTVWHPTLMKTPFILSVDRADYTKGVTDRIQAIEAFFETYPEWAGRIVFAQISGKTRPGLRSFDAYWEECQRLYKRLDDRWSTDNWNPLVWIESSFSPAELAHAYRTADGMLVNAVRDGLNLTAKEYIACQVSNPGVLSLSKGTGAWQELGNYALELDPGEPQSIATNIHRGLMMNNHERAWRAAMLKEQIRQNSLGKWWYTMSSLLVEQRRSPEIALLRETS